MKTEKPLNLFGVQQLLNACKYALKVSDASLEDCKKAGFGKGHAAFDGETQLNETLREAIQGME
jgi:hypothetical protein